jgi:hypothetical protein
VLNEIARGKRERKATKANDAKVPEFLWEEHLLQDCPTPWVVAERTWLRQAIVLLCTRMLKWWKRRVARSFLAWIKRENPELAYAKGAHAPVVSYDGHRYVWKSGDGKNDNLDGFCEYKKWWKSRMLVANADLRPGADAIRRAAKSSWWNWNDGLRPFHWRWPRWYQGTIQDGLKVHFQGKKPAYRKAQRCSPEQDTRRKMREKLKAVRDRRYITPGFVKSLTSFFSVPKGDDDIRMVYSGFESGLNDSIWVPRFILPTMETHLRGVDEETCMADNDFGECFLNFILHAELRELAGVEVLDLVEADAEWMPRHRLEEVRGFLVYVTRMYPCMRSYLIGMHVTIDSWHDIWDEQGWRLSAREMHLRSNATNEFEEEANEEGDDPEAPDEVRAVPCLGDDIRALQSLMVSIRPVVRRV